MFRIGEFSQIVRVSPRMLRHYEKYGLFYPAEIDKVNGYRLYSASQIPLLLRILYLKEMGFSINEISIHIENFGENGYLEGVLQNKSQELRFYHYEKLYQISAIKKLFGKSYIHIFTRWITILFWRSMY